MRFRWRSFRWMDFAKACFSVRRMVHRWCTMVSLKRHAMSARPPCRRFWISWCRKMSLPKRRPQSNKSAQFHWSTKSNALKRSERHWCRLETCEFLLTLNFTISRWRRRKRLWSLRRFVRCWVPAFLPKSQLDRLNPLRRCWVTGKQQSQSKILWMNGQKHNWTVALMNFVGPFLLFLG